MAVAVRTLAVGLSVSLGLPSTLAQPAPKSAAPVLRAFSDSDAIGGDVSGRYIMDRTRLCRRGGPAAAAGPGSPAAGPAAGGGAAAGGAGGAAAGGGFSGVPAPMEALKAYDDSIAQVEAMLAGLKPDDPQRAQLAAGLESMKKARAQFAAQAAGPAPVPAKPLTLAQALANARKALESAAGPKATAALAASPAAEDPEQAEAAAVTAVASGNPGGALAVLLAAHAKAPKEPMHLVNAAATLNVLGRPAEALALLDAAEALKVEPVVPLWNGRAVMLNNRGHALLLAGRYADAEATLRKAVALEPLLAEARLNLAGALECQGKKKQAEALYARGVQRTPVKNEVRTCGGSWTGRCEPGDERTRRAAVEVFDLSAGTEGKLPPLPYPKTVQETTAVAPLFVQLKQEALDWVADFNKREMAVKAKLDQREKRALDNPPARQPSKATTRRFQDIMTAIYEHADEPGLRDLKAAEIKAFERQAKAVDLLETLEINSLKCPEWLPGYTKRHNVWYPATMAWDAAVRAYYAKSHKHITGLIANLSDPLHHEFATLQAEAYARSTFYSLASIAGDSWISMAAYTHSCGLAATQGSKVETPEPDAPKAPPCPPFVKGVKFSIKLGVLNAAVNCEKVEVEGSGPSWLTAFANVGYAFAPPGKLSAFGSKFNGSLTVGGGLKAGISGPKLGAGGSLGVSAKAGVYVTVDGTGSVTDVGVAGGTSAGAKAGPVSLNVGGPGGKISIASAFIDI